MSDVFTVDKITKVFRARGRDVRAVDNVSFTVAAGRTFGLVGESGSGKSTVARCALRLIEPTSGTSIIAGQDLAKLSGKQLRAKRREFGMVFQNPVAALNARLTVRQSISEPLRTHTRMGKRELDSRVAEVLDEVGLAQSHGDRLPHQLSGGQCQRVGIARALTMRPSVLILDEPTSALDVSVQAQVLNLLQDLRAEHNLSYLLISHDLDVVRYMSEDAGVMRRGQLVESGPADHVLVTPDEEYTKELLASTPKPPGVVA